MPAGDDRRVLMIFVDGLGLGQADRVINPYMEASLPALDSLVGGRMLTSGLKFVSLNNGVVVATDACLGVPGIPQSATGQTTLWTGVNASAKMGRHINGFPSPDLKEILTEKSIFVQLGSRGYRTTFANAFTSSFFDAGMNPVSTSTAAALAGGLRLRDTSDLLRGEAVYQDITHELIHRRERREQVPPITATAAGRRLGCLALRYHFCLFEFFQTDVVGHQQDMAKAVAVLERVDGLLAGVLEVLDLEETLLLITSDHGNIENIKVPTHTMNQVPTILVGPGAREGAGSIHDLADITPFIVRFLTQGRS